MTIDADCLHKTLERDDHRPVCRSLAEVHLGTASRLLSTHVGRGSTLRPWLKDAEINRDRDLRLQYLAGMGLNSYEADRIHRSLRLYRRSRDDLVSATTARERPWIVRPGTLGTQNTTDKRDRR